LKASALAFGRIVADPPTPSAMTLKAMEENTRNAAAIFFIDLVGKKEARGWGTGFKKSSPFDPAAAFRRKTGVIITNQPAGSSFDQACL
jgi:hypothetical protein